LALSRVAGRLGAAVEAAIAAIAKSKSKDTAELPDASEVGKLI
jgi:hypothetical protein